MTPLTTRQQEILAIVDRLGSAKSSVIAEAAGLTHERAIYVLRILRKRNLVGCSHAGRSARWYAMSNAAIAADMIEAERRLAKERERAADRWKKQRRAEVVRAYREHAFERWCHGVNQRVIPAAEAPPLRVNAPNSVFNLAHAHMEATA